MHTAEVSLSFVRTVVLASGRVIPLDAQPCARCARDRPDKSDSTGCAIVGTAVANLYICQIGSHGQ